MQGWYYVKSLTGQWHDRVQTEANICNRRQLFRPCWVSSVRRSKLCVHRQHSRLRSFASSCFTVPLKADRCQKRGGRREFNMRPLRTKTGRNNCYWFILSLILLIIIDWYRRAGVYLRRPLPKASGKTGIQHAPAANENWKEYEHEEPQLAQRLVALVSI